MFELERRLPVYLICRADDADQPLGDWPATQKLNFKLSSGTSSTSSGRKVTSHKKSFKRYICLHWQQ